MSPDAVARQDLDGDGDEDTMVDESGFGCSTSATLFTPLGGAQLHAIVGDRHDVWMAQAWRLIEWEVCLGSSVSSLGGKRGWTGRPLMSR